MAEPVGKRVDLVIHEGGKGGGGPPAGPEPPRDDFPPTPPFASEDMLATDLVRDLGPDWRCAAGQWFCWDGMRWLREQTRLVWDKSGLVCREVAALIDDKRAAQKVASSQAIYAAVRLAEADRQVAMVMSLFDGDKWLLNTPDGIVDLRSGQLEPHDRGALMTKISAAGPMAKGECRLFMRYLHDATGGDEHLMRYLQRVAGYCLTGSIEEHCILFFHGPGGSGKTTFLLVIQDLLGDYAVNSPMNAFTVSTGERHPTELAHFFGARVVTASEIEEGMRWDEGKLKAISGGDKITARYMRGDFFTFEPQFKLLLAGNHRPRMRSADDAMRRRMQVIPFRHKPATGRQGLAREAPGRTRRDPQMGRRGRGRPAPIGGPRAAARRRRGDQRVFQEREHDRPLARRALQGAEGRGRRLRVLG
jgi:putative DNA primase/helicase